MKAKLGKFLPRCIVAMGLLSKASSPMLIVSSPFSIVNSLTPLFAKAKLPTDKTLSGIVTEVSPLQYAKADSPIVVTLSGIVKDVNPLQ